MLMRAAIVGVALLCVGGLVVCKAEKGKMDMSIQQAIVKANATAQQLGYNLSTMVVNADSGNTKWQQFAGKINLSAHLPEVAERIQGKQYFAIYYEPSNIDQLGGDLWIFIDRTTGEVLDVWQGK